MKPTIAVRPGDGIGPEVTAAAPDVGGTATTAALTTEVVNQLSWMRWGHGSEEEPEAAREWAV